MDDTSPHLTSLLDRLKQAQHTMIEDAARQPGLPSTAIIRRIAELENTIAAVLALIEDGKAATDPIAWSASLREQRARRRIAAIRQPSGLSCPLAPLTK